VEGLAQLRDLSWHDFGYFPRGSTNHFDRSVTMIRVLLFGILMLTLGIGAFVLELKSIRDNDALKSRGLAAAGTTSGASTTRRSAYWIKFKYTLAGHAYESGGGVTEEVFRKYTSANGLLYSPKSIPLRYLPEDPQVVRIADPDLPADYNAPSVWAWVIILAFMGPGVLAMYSCFRQVRTSWASSKKLVG
jgi:hypothetical protein